MIPLRDENPSASWPAVTLLLIVVNGAAFLYELMLGSALRPFMFEWGMVPARLSAALADGSEPLTQAALPLASSMFLHGGWIHLLGNMWYLWIFGDNVEDRMGHLPFLVFYLGAGLFAGVLHVFFNPLSGVPAVGASGAIAGVLGAYLVAFPRARIVALVPLFPFFQVMALPAVLMLGLWFVYQFFSGALSLAWGGGGGGGVAWWAHIGGFGFGAAAALLMGGAGRSRSSARPV